MTLILTCEEVRSILEMPELIDIVENSLVQSSMGQTIQPVRLRLNVPKYESRLISMPAYLDGSDVMGMKVFSGAVSNPQRGLPGISAIVLLCDPTTGQFLSVMDGSYITEVRTAAASAVATKYLARPEASILGVIGAGLQGRSHLWAISTVRPIRLVKVFDALPERALRYKDDMEKRFGLHVDVCDTAEIAVRNSDVVVTVTTSKTPVVHGAWLKEGAHINAVGAAIPDARELDNDAICRAKVVTDSMEALFAEAGDVLIPIAEGRMSRDQVHGEIGEIAAGQKSGRTNSTEITIYKSLGIAAEDVVTAKLVYDRARERGLGTELEM